MFSTKYWQRHALISMSIMLVGTIVARYVPLPHVFAGALAGSCFYLGREVRDYEKLKEGWDMPGLLGGTLPPLAIYVCIVLLVKYGPLGEVGFFA